MSNFFKKKEKRDQAFMARLPRSVVEKIRKLAKQANMSQSEVIEELVKFYESKSHDEKKLI